MNYPGHIITKTEKQPEIIKAIKTALNKKMPDIERLDTDLASIGNKTETAIKLFQARNTDNEGRPLKQDGQIGPLTWSALFETGDHEYAYDAPTVLLHKAVEVAAQEADEKVREYPPNSNKGPKVEIYLRSIGLGGGYSWCAAFVYWCYLQASKEAERACPVVRTGGCLYHWEKSEANGADRINAQDAIKNPTILRPGHIFIMDHGRGLGHTGIIERVSGGLLHTIEGNTDASKTREGGGVYRLIRKVSEINKGYIDYSKA